MPHARSFLPLAVHEFTDKLRPGAEKRDIDFGMEFAFGNLQAIGCRVKPGFKNPSEKGNTR